MKTLLSLVIMSAQCDRDRCSEVEYVIIPCSNCSQGIRHSWSVSSSIPVPTKNVKSLAPLLGGGRGE